MTTGTGFATADLVERHLPLVPHVLFQIASHFPRHADRDELAQAAMLGLVEAAQRFDPERGVPFDRWATLRIRGAILDAVRAIDFAPRSLRAASRDVHDAREALTAELRRTPKAEEVAARLGVPVSELAGIEGRVHRALVLSLDAKAGAKGDDSAATLAETITIVGDEDPSEVLERRERDVYLAHALRLLPERLRRIVVGYFLEGRSSTELAGELGVTESRVSQLRTEALTMLRAGLDAQYGAAHARTAANPRAAARHASYASAIAKASSYRSRLAHPVPDQRSSASRDGSADLPAR